MFYVVAHKLYDAPKLDSFYKTIFVGGGEIQEYARRHKYLADSIGNDNISEKNPYYCELTALYWIWKNLPENERFVGLNHYRRYFKSPTANQILTGEECDSILQDYDVILLKPLQLKKGTIEKFYYTTTGYVKDLDLMKKSIRKLFPDYTETCEKFLHSSNMSYANMFAMSKERVVEYCEFLFPVLFEMEKTLNMKNYTDSEKRVYGYLGELLINIWVEKNNLTVFYVDVINTENTSLSKKAVIKNNLKKMIKGIIYFPSGIPYRRRKKHQ